MPYLKHSSACLVLLVVLLSSAQSAPAFACSYNKLDLDYCGDTPPKGPKSDPPPLNQPKMDDNPNPPQKGTRPTAVCFQDSRGKTVCGPGVTTPF
jgi:hypothetical protein